MKSESFVRMEVGLIDEINYPVEIEILDTSSSGFKIKIPIPNFNWKIGNQWIQILLNDLNVQYIGAPSTIVWDELKSIRLDYKNQDAEALQEIIYLRKIQFLEIGNAEPFFFIVFLPRSNKNLLGDGLLRTWRESPGENKSYFDINTESLT